MKKQEKKYVEETATKNFNELIESCENLTINQKRVAFKRIIQDEVEPGEVGALVRQKLSEHLETLDAKAGLKLEGQGMKNLKEIRKKYKLYQTDMANLLECSYSHYVKVENGFTKPSYDMLLKIKEEFPSVNLNELIKK